MPKLSLVALLVVGCEAEPIDPIAAGHLEDDEIFDAEGAPDLDDLPFDHLPPPPALTMIGTCPGFVTFNVTSATPSGNLRFFWGPNLGTSTVPSGVCAGTLIRLLPPIQVSVPFTANGVGNLTASTTLTAADCGSFLHVMDMSTCTFSNAVPL